MPINDSQAMGVVCAPDIFQSIRMEILGDLDFVLVYIDDMGKQ